MIHPNDLRQALHTTFAVLVSLYLAVVLILVSANLSAPFQLVSGGDASFELNDIEPESREAYHLAGIYRSQNQNLSDGMLLASTQSELSFWDSGNDVYIPEELRTAQIKNLLGYSGAASYLTITGALDYTPSGGSSATNGGVSEGDVGTYGGLQRAAETGDGLTPDHIPSFAAVRQAAEDAGLDLSDSQLRALRNNTNCVVVGTCDHQQLSRTYGGRNNSTQIANDATDLRAAANADLAIWEQQWRNQGWSEQRIQDTRQQVHDYNAQTFEDLGIDY